MTTYIVFREPPKQPSGDFERQLERLLEKEKNARINSEHFNSVAVLKDIITLCYQAEEWGTLQEQLVFLMGRRGQSKKAQIEMIQLAMSWLPNIPQPHRTALILTIRDVCAKKIFLEVEYARCVLMIVRGKEDEDDILEAANILQEVQVETYGSMDKREKLEFILYQMKIMLKKQDYVRFFIISKKINPPSLNSEDIVDLKLTFYAYLAIYYNHEGRTSECCAAYRALFQTLSSAKKPLPQVLDFGFSARPADVLGNYVALLVLQSYSEANHKQLKALTERSDVEKHVHLLHLINKFLLEEIVSCKVEDYQPESFELFRSDFPRSSIHLLELRRMLVQHDIRVIARYYSEISLARVAQLLRVEQDYCEEELCALNNSGVIRCRIDRIAGVVDFRPIENQEVQLKQWNHSINTILDLVDVATNLIHREREVYKK